MERDGVADGRFIGNQRIGRIDAELWLRRPGRRPSAEPGQLLAHEVLALGLGRRRDPLALDPLQDIGSVPSLERFDDPVVHLPHRGADLVEEPSVVRHDRQAAGAR